MKNINCLMLMFLCTIVLFSCTSTSQVANMNMVSTRNIDSNKEYKLLSTYQGGTKSEFKQVLKGQKKKLGSIDDAVNRTLKAVPGGEYLMNCRIFLVENQMSGKKAFVCEGDVWGTDYNEYHGWKPGDTVTYKKGGKYQEGLFVGHKDIDTCLIKTSDGKIIEMKYRDIVKISK